MRRQVGSYPRDLHLGERNGVGGQSAHAARNRGGRQGTEESSSFHYVSFKFRKRLDFRARVSTESETAGPSTAPRSGRDDNSVAENWSQKRSNEWLLMVP